MPQNPSSTPQQQCHMPTTPVRAKSAFKADVCFLIPGDGDATAAAVGSAAGASGCSVVDFGAIVAIAFAIKGTPGRVNALF